MRVLVVDDSDVNLELTKCILELVGAEVRLARNGQEAFEYLEGQPNTIDVVLMDVQMPVLDGHDATRRIRLELKLADLPIIALTAGALSSERQRAIVAGMDDYIIKPFDPQALVHSILKYAVPGAGQMRKPIDKTPETDTSEVWPEIEGIDSSDVRGRLSENFGLFQSMLSRLLDEFSDVEISAGTDVGALVVHAGRMHKLRGSAGMLGARVIHQLAGEAEAACLADQVECATHLATRLTTRLQRLRENAAPIFKVAQAEANPANS